MSNYDLSQLSPYEREAWDDVQRWRQSDADRRSRVPAVVRDRAKMVSQRAATTWKSVPGNAQVSAIVADVLAGGQEALTDAVAASLQRDLIVSAAREVATSLRG